MMPKQQADDEWQCSVRTTAKGWRLGFGDQTLHEAWTQSAFEHIPGEVVATRALDNPWRAFHGDVDAYLEALNDMASAINRELDRLGWTSETAPAGDTCLDAFPTEEAGLVAVSDTQETTVFDAEGLYRALTALDAPISYDHVWDAMLPHMRES